jgi:hypothetical protein
LPEADERWSGQTLNATLTETRALRDAYGKRAARALANHFPTLPPPWWPATIERTCRCPYGEIEGLQFLATRIGDIGDWSALTRFCWLAEKVWEMECGELARQNCTWARQ